MTISDNFIEIVGLHKTSDGRSCSRHECCGWEVIKGSVLYLKPVVITGADNLNEYAIVACIMEDGLESCKVGYVAKEFLFFRQLYEHKLVQVNELYKDSKNREYLKRSKLFGGVAVCRVIS